MRFAPRSWLEVLKHIQRIVVVLRVARFAPRSWLEVLNLIQWIVVPLRVARCAPHIRLEVLKQDATSLCNIIEARLHYTTQKAQAQKS